MVEDAATRSTSTRSRATSRASMVSGDADVSTVSGDVKLTDVRGDVDVGTVSGDIELRGVTSSSCAPRRRAAT